MMHMLDCTEARRAENFAKPRLTRDEPLPIGTAMAIIAGASAVLWSLIAIAVTRLI